MVLIIIKISIKINILLIKGKGVVFPIYFEAEKPAVGGVSVGLVEKEQVGMYCIFVQL